MAQQMIPHEVRFSTRGVTQPAEIGPEAKVGLGPTSEGQVTERHSDSDRSQSIQLPACCGGGYTANRI